jgi:AcrR family transcriptional regulator
VAYHFKDKGDIIRTAMEFVIAQGQALTTERVAAAVTPRLKILAVVEAFFHWASEDTDGMAVYVLFLYYCTIHEDYRATHDAMRRTGIERLVGVMKQDAALSKGKSDEDLADLAKSLQYLSFGALVDLVTTGGLTPKALARARRQVLAATDTLLDGV